MDAIVNFFKRIASSFVNFGNFMKDVRSELRKVTWPTKQDIISSTTVVIVCSILIGVYLWLNDFVFSKLLALIIR
jgi:preprotein translocase subunit SecE